MHIVMVTDQFPPVTGGAERQAARLCAELAKRGHQLTVLTGRWKREAPRHESRDGYTVERLSTLYAFWGIRGLRRYGQDVFAAHLRRRLRELAPSTDIFHAHFVRRAAAVTLATARPFGVPVLVKETNSGEKNSFSGLAREHRGAMMQQLFLRELRHVAVLNEQAEREYRALPFDHLVTHRVFNGIECDEGPRWSPQTPPELLFLGRLRPEKGARELLRSFAIVRKDFPNWRLRYCGDGPELGELRRQIATLGLDNVVTAAGATTTPLSALARATIVVLPSYSEGMSNTLLEAMSIGTPAVATRVGANAEMLEPGGGWISESPDPEHLAPTLRAAMASESERRQRSETSRTRVRARYSMRASADRYEEVYAKMREP